MIKRFSKHSLTNSFKTNTTRISLNLHLLAARKFFKFIHCHTYCFNVELIVAFVIAINHYNCNWLKQFVSQTTTSLLVNTLLYRPKHRWHCWSTQWHFYLIDHRIRLAWIDIYNHIPPIFDIVWVLFLTGSHVLITTSCNNGLSRDATLRILMQESLLLIQ